MRQVFIASSLSLAILATPGFADYFKITAGDVQFPSEMFTMSQVASDYIITDTYNNGGSVYPAPVTAFIKLPVNYTVIPATNLPATEPPACGSGTQFALNQSHPACTIRVIYNSAQALGPTQPEFVPVVCLSDSTKATCNKLSTRTSIDVVDSMQDAATLAVQNNTNNSANDVFFAPGQIREVDVTNTSSHPAYHVHMAFQPALQDYVDLNSITSCETLAPGATCALKVKMKQDLPIKGKTMYYNIQATNSKPLRMLAHVVPSLLRTTPVQFVKPGLAVMTVYNLGNLSVTLPTASEMTTALKALTNLHNVTFNTDPSQSTCLSSDTVAASGSCTYAFNATANTSGYGQLSLTFTPDGQSSITKQVPLVAMHPSLQVIALQDSNHNVLSDQQGINTITIKNTGAFAWQHPHVTLISSNHDNHFQMLNLSQCTGHVIAAKQQCQIHFQINPKFSSSANSGYDSLVIGGDNVATIRKTIVPNHVVSILPASSNQQHLSALALTVANNTNGAIALTHLQTVISSHLKSIVACTGLHNHCGKQFQTTCSQGMSLAAGQSCNIWFEMHKVHHFIRDDEGTLQIKASYQTANNKSLTSIQSPMIRVRADNDLIAGGSFLLAGSFTNGNYLLKYDGQTWQPLNNATIFSTGTGVNSILSWNGDVYFGGDYISTTPGASDVSRWDGSNMHALSTGLEGGVNPATNVSVQPSVHALYADSETGDLLVGGQFMDAGGLSNTLDIAQWDGTNWSALGAAFEPDDIYNSQINAITRFDLKDASSASNASSTSSQIVVGGTFENLTNCEGNSNTQFIAALGANASSGKACWSSLLKYYGSSRYTIGNTVNALLTTNSREQFGLSNTKVLYIGGLFIYVGDYNILLRNWGWSRQDGLAIYSNSRPGTTSHQDDWIGYLSFFRQGFVAPTFSPTADVYALLKYTGYNVYIGGNFNEAYIDNEDSLCTSTPSDPGKQGTSCTFYQLHNVIRSSSALNQDTLDGYAANLYGGGYTGTDDSVYALAYDDTDNEIFIGGQFNDPEPRLVGWKNDSSEWDMFSGTTFKVGNIYALAWVPSLTLDY